MLRLALPVLGMLAATAGIAYYVHRERRTNVDGVALEALDVSEYALGGVDLDPRNNPAAEDILLGFDSMGFVGGDARSNVSIQENNSGSLLSDLLSLLDWTPRGGEATNAGSEALAVDGKYVGAGKPDPYDPGKYVGDGKPDPFYSPTSYDDTGDGFFYGLEALFPWLLQGVSAPDYVRGRNRPFGVPSPVLSGVTVGQRTQFAAGVGDSNQNVVGGWGGFQPSHWSAPQVV